MAAPIAMGDIVSLASYLGGIAQKDFGMHATRITAEKSPGTLFRRV